MKRAHSSFRNNTTLSDSEEDRDCFSTAVSLNPKRTKLELKTKESSGASKQYNLLLESFKQSDDSSDNENKDDDLDLNVITQLEVMNLRNYREEAELGRTAEKRNVSNEEKDSEDELASSVGSMGENLQGIINTMSQMNVNRQQSILKKEADIKKSASVNNATVEKNKGVTFLDDIDVFSDNNSSGSNASEVSDTGSVFAEERDLSRATQYHTEDYASITDHHDKYEVSEEEDSEIESDSFYNETSHKCPYCGEDHALPSFNDGSNTSSVENSNDDNDSEDDDMEEFLVPNDS